MSFVPLLTSHWWPHYEHNENFPYAHPSRLPNLHPMDTVWPSDEEVEQHKALHRTQHIPHHYKYQPWWNKLHRENSDKKIAVDEKDQFRVVLDVQQFTPEEITVKVVDNHIIVEATHDDKKDDHGWIARSFVRRYQIPNECDIEKIQPKISSDGILIISIPHKKKTEVNGERVLNIEKTNKPAILHRNDLKG